MAAGANLNVTEVLHRVPVHRPAGMDVREIAGQERIDDLLDGDRERALSVPVTVPLEGTVLQGSGWRATLNPAGRSWRL